MPYNSARLAFATRGSGTARHFTSGNDLDPENLKNKAAALFNCFKAQLGGSPHKEKKLGKEYSGLGACVAFQLQTQARATGSEKANTIDVASREKIRTG